MTYINILVHAAFFAYYILGLLFSATHWGGFTKGKQTEHFASIVALIFLSKYNVVKLHFEKITNEVQGGK